MIFQISIVVYTHESALICPYKTKWRQNGILLEQWVSLKISKCFSILQVDCQIKR